MNQDHTKVNKYQQNQSIKFTYLGTEIQRTENIFKDTNTGIAFRTINTIQKHLQP
jgi:hypothetical protein